MEEFKQSNTNRNYAALIALAVAALPVPDFALAQDVATTLDNFSSNQLVVIPPFIAVVCYIAGVTMIMMGALKLKDHADDARGNKLSSALARLAVGGVLIALPSFVGWVSTTLAINGNAMVPFTKFGVSFTRG